MIKNIYLQRFAEETIPAKQEEAKLESKPDEAKSFKSSIRSVFGLKEKETKKEPEKEAEKKPDEAVEKPDKEKEVKVEESVKEPEFDEILYNKEKVKIPVTERQTYLQKGYNYDKVKADAEAAKATLLRVAKAEGFKTVDEYLGELGTREKTKLAEQIEEAAGDPEKIDELINGKIESHPKIIETLERERKQLFKDAVAELSKDPIFKEVEPKFNELMEINPTAKPELIYKVARNDYLTPEKISELIAKEREAASKDKETAIQKTIADFHDKERRAAPKGGDAGDGKDVVVPSDFSKKIAGIFGVSAAKVAQRSHEKMKRS